MILTALLLALGLSNRWLVELDPARLDALTRLREHTVIYFNDAEEETASAGFRYTNGALVALLSFNSKFYASLTEAEREAAVMHELAHAFILSNGEPRAVELQCDLLAALALEKKGRAGFAAARTMLAKLPKRSDKPNPTHPNRERRIASLFSFQAASGTWLALNGLEWKLSLAR